MTTAKADGTKKTVTTKITTTSKKVVDALKTFASGSTKQVRKTVASSGKTNKTKVYKDKFGNLKKKIVFKSYTKGNGTKMKYETVIKASGEKIATVKSIRKDKTVKTVIKRYSASGELLSTKVTDTAK